MTPSIARAAAWTAVVLTASGAVLAADAPAKPPQELRLGGIWMVKGGRVDVPAGQATSADLYSFAGTTRIDGTLQGDVATFAANVLVPGTVDGDVWSFTEDVSIDGTVAGGLRAGANKVVVRGAVGRNALVLANSFRLDPTGRVEGSIASYAGSTTIEGSIGGSLLARSGKVEINGPVGGDVDVRCDELSFGPLSKLSPSGRRVSGYPSVYRRMRVPGSRGMVAVSRAVSGSPVLMGTLCESRALMSPPRTGPLRNAGGCPAPL